MPVVIVMVILVVVRMQITYSTDDVKTDTVCVSPRFHHLASPLFLQKYMLDSRTHSIKGYMASLMEMINTLEWDHIIVIFDNVHNTEITQLLPMIGMTSLHNLDDLQDDIEVKQLLQQLHTRFFPRLYFLLLCNYSRAMDLIQIADWYDLESNKTTDFCHFSSWLVVGPSQCQRDILPHIHHMENIVLVCYDGKASQTGDLLLRRQMLTPSGRAFSEEKSFKDIKGKQNIFPNIKYGLNNRTLIVSLLLTRNGLDGYFRDLLETIANTLNFSYEIVHPEGMRWGGIVDGRWNGLVGQLQRREVDLAVGTLTINEDREKVMDFLYPPVFTDVDDIMYQLHTDDKKSWEIYLKPLKPMVLLILFISVIYFTLITFTIAEWEKTNFQGNQSSETQQLRLRKRITVMEDTFIHIFGIVLNRGTIFNTSRHSLRILLFTWGVFAVIIASCYSASLVASFTVQKPDLPFTSLGELVRQKEYKWGVVPGDIREHILKTSKDSDMKLAWSGILEHNITDPSVLNEDHSPHIAKVKTDKYAYITSRYRIENARGENCNIRRVGQPIIWHQMGLGVPTDYPLKRELEDILTVIADSGLPDYWWRRWGKTKADQCVQDDSVTTLPLTDIASAFYLLCVGVGAAGVILLVEILKYKFQFS